MTLRERYCIVLYAYFIVSAARRCTVSYCAR